MANISRIQAYGIVLVRDPRVSEVDNDQFLDQMEKYYAQSDGVKDARPEVGRQTSPASRLYVTAPVWHAKYLWKHGR